MKQLVKLFILSVLLGVSMSAQAGLWDNIKGGASKAWEGTKENASKMTDEGKQVYHEGQGASFKEIKKEMEKQGVIPVKSKEDDAGIAED